MQCHTWQKCIIYTIMLKNAAVARNIKSAINIFPKKNFSQQFRHFWLISRHFPAAVKFLTFPGSQDKWLPLT